MKKIYILILFFIFAIPIAYFFYNRWSESTPARERFRREVEGRLQKIKDDDILNYDKLYTCENISEGKYNYLLTSLTYLKSEYEGLYFLERGNLTKKQEEAILIFYEPYPVARELAEKIVASPREKFRQLLDDYYNRLEAIELETNFAYEKDKSVRGMSKMTLKEKDKIAWTKGFHACPYTVGGKYRYRRCRWYCKTCKGEPTISEAELLALPYKVSGTNSNSTCNAQN